jgi:acyl-CoA thioesterase-1
MKRKVYNLVAGAVLFVFSSSVFSVEASDPKKVACVGDSITYGAGVKARRHNNYPAQLGRMLGENWEVKNFGVNGATLLKKGDKPYWKLAAYQSALQFEPDVVIIKLGTNDTKPHNWKHKAEYINNYVEMIKSFKALKSKPTVWVCYPVPAYPERWGISDKTIKTEVMPMVDAVSKMANVKIIDLYTALSEKSELFPDKIHPNAAGAKIIAETIHKTVSAQPAARVTSP